MTDNIWTDIVSVGDLVKIEVNALWRDRPTVWRKVKSIRTDRDGDQYITVGLGGWPHYIVRDSEIIEVN